MEGKRYKGLIITENKLLEIIQKYCNDSKLPKGCFVTGVNYDCMRCAFIARIHHKDFPEQSPGSMLELIKISTGV